MNKKQLIVAWIMGILICFSLFINKDTITSDKKQVMEQRREYVEKHSMKNKKDGEICFDDLVAAALYPYPKESIGTNFLGLKFKGKFYQYKWNFLLTLLIIGCLLIYSLKSEKSKQ